MARTKIMSRSVKALVEEKGLVGETPDQVMARECQVMVDSAAAIGWDGPPFCVEQLASIRGIGLDFAKPPSGEAQLIPLPNNRFQIVCDPDVAGNRQRFSIAHELAHTVFPDCATQAQFRNGNGSDSAVERLCHIGAGHLLMPKSAFLDLAPVPGELTSSLRGLCDRFAVSQEAAVMHLVRQQSFDCIALFLRPGLRKSEQEQFESTGIAPELKMRILWSEVSPTVSAYIPKNKSLPKSSCVYETNQLGVPKSATERIQFSESSVADWFVEAFPLRSISSDAPTVVAVLSPG